MRAWSESKYNEKKKKKLTAKWAVANSIDSLRKHLRAYLMALPTNPPECSHGVWYRNGREGCFGMLHVIMQTVYLPSRRWWAITPGIKRKNRNSSASKATSVYAPGFICLEFSCMPGPTKLSHPWMVINNDISCNSLSLWYIVRKTNGRISSTALPARWASRIWATSIWWWIWTAERTQWTPSKVWNKLHQPQRGKPRLETGSALLWRESDSGCLIGNIRCFFKLEKHWLGWGGGGGDKWPSKGKTVVGECTH